MSIPYELAARLRGAELNHLRRILEAEPGSRLRASYFPANSAAELLLLSAETEQGDLAGWLLTEEPEAARLLTSILHADHHPSYEEAPGPTTRVYHFPFPDQLYAPLPRPLMIVIPDPARTCVVLTADSHAILSEAQTRRREGVHLRDGGEVRWEPSVPEGDLDFWQAKLKRGIW